MGIKKTSRKIILGVIQGGEGEGTISSNKFAI